MSTHINRRESFRLEDTLQLRLRILDENSLNAITADFDSFRMRYCLKSHAQNQMDIHQPKLMQIRQRNPEVAQYLEYLETRLLRLSEQVERLSSVEPDEDVMELQSQGNLSAAGLNFTSNHEFATGQMLEMGLVLSTSAIHVVMLAEVVRVDRHSDETISTSVSYTLIHGEDKEAIVRHLVKLQQQQLHASRSAEITDPLV